MNLSLTDTFPISSRRLNLALGMLAGALVVIATAIGVYGFFGSATIPEPFSYIDSEETVKICATATGGASPSDISLEGSGNIAPAGAISSRARCFYYTAPWSVNEVKLVLRLKLRDDLIGIMPFTVIPAYDYPANTSR